MEAQFFADRTLAREAEVDERARVEVAQLELADRLRGAVGREVVVGLLDGSKESGSLGRVGSDWLVLNTAARQWLFPFHAVSYFENLGRQAQKPPAGRALVFPLAGALRGLARERLDVVVHLSGGAPGRVLRGVIDRVGRDFLDIAVTGGEARRTNAVTAVATVAFDALLAVCSASRREY
jgi:hypothetical protein